MSVKSAERQFILEFIEVYRSLPALWDVKCKDYTNRGKKNEQYNVLIEKYRENIPNADKQDVIKKINSLRTNFRKELKRIQDQKNNCASQKEVEPSLWYFEEMKFLQNLEAPTPSPSSKNYFVDFEPAPYEDVIKENSCKTNDGLADSENSIQLGTPKKKKKTCDISQKLMELTCKCHKRTPDYHNTIAAAWAVELKNMDPSQQMLAKKFINEILFEGQMGTLHRNSVVINNSSRTSSPSTVQSLPSFSKQERDACA